MLTLIEGNVSYERDAILTERIKEVLETKTRAFLIVPEQETLTRERAMASILPPSAPLTFEVTNFTRFINTAFRTLGGLSGEYCDKAAKSLIMWRTLTELSPVLNMTRGKGEVTPGNVTRALSAVGEMQSLAILPEDLSRVEGTGLIKDARLRAKLSDLSLIFSLYKKLLSEKYGDVSDDTLSLADMLSRDGSYLRGTKIFIDGFTSFTEPQYRLIGELIRHSDVSVTLAIPRGASSMFEYTELSGTRSRLLRIADSVAAVKKLVRSDSNEDGRSYPARLSERIFRQSSEVLPYTGGQDIRIFRTPTPFDESFFVAADIKRRVMGGEKYSDFAIIARSCESYAGVLDRALDAESIPYFFSRTRDISSFEAIKLINTAYRVVKRGFAREDVITYLKCALSDIPREDADIFELYVEKWNIDGRSFTQDEPWCMNPRGYESFKEKDLTMLERINSVKDTLIEPLIAFRDDTGAARTVREHAEALYRFTVKIGLEEKLRERAKLLITLGESRRAEENSRLYKIILDSLDRLTEIMGDMPADRESFINQLSVVLGSGGMGSIPSHVDEVTVGSADMIRLCSKKHVYLIGVNEGKFPALASERSYFSDRDKLELTSSGLNIEPDNLERAARELYSFVRAMSFADESLTVSYCERSGALEPLLPSEVIGRIEELTGGEVKTVCIDSIPILDRIYSPSDAYALSPFAKDGEKRIIDRALTEVGERDILEKTERPVSNGKGELDAEAIAIVYKGDLYLSQSRMESYLSCPFSYFLKYNLKLDDEARAELSPSVIGSFLHAILEDFFGEVRSSGKSVREISEDEKGAITERAASRYIGDILGCGYGKERTRVAIKRLCRAASPVIDGICEEFSECKFEPTLFELSTDGKEKDDASPIVYEAEGGRKIIIRGKVDRVDTYNHGDDVYVRVVDYKTGAKEFSPKDLDAGINMQMFLYLKSIVDTESKEFLKRIGNDKGGRLIPAGVIYTKTSVKDATVKHSSDEEALRAAKDQSTREGMVLDDEISLGAMNPRFTPLKYPETSRNKPSNDERKYTLGDWETITDGIESVVRDIADRMCSGDVSAEPNPIKKFDPCEFCSYRAICRRK